MSQELFALIGEQQVELRQVRAERDALRQKFEELSNFVARAAKAGTPIRLVDQSETQELPEDLEMPEVPADAQPRKETYTPVTEVVRILDEQAEAENHSEPALSH